MCNYVLLFTLGNKWILWDWTYSQPNEGVREFEALHHFRHNWWLCRCDIILVNSVSWRWKMKMTFFLNAPFSGKFEYLDENMGFLVKWFSSLWEGFVRFCLAKLQAWWRKWVNLLFDLPPLTLDLAQGFLGYSNNLQRMLATMILHSHDLLSLTWADWFSFGSVWPSFDSVPHTYYL